MKSILLFAFIVFSVCNSFAGYNISAGSISQSNVSQPDSVLKGGLLENGEDSLLLVSNISNLQPQNLQTADSNIFSSVSQAKTNLENPIKREHYRLEALKEVCEFLFGSIDTLGGPVEYDALSLQLFFFTR